MTGLPSNSQPTRSPLFAVNGEEPPTALYITLGPENAVKMGTCWHCVAIERERPARAWSAEGDRELDFDRDALLSHLAELGVAVVDRQAYVCP